MAHKKTRFARNFSLPELRRKGQHSIRSFTRKELASFLSLFCVAFVTLIWMLGILNSEVSTNVPIHGGKLQEGIIGTPRFVNPVLAVSDADKDLTSLVYSGLMRLDTGGIPTPDLADSYSVSPDGKTYTFIIKDTAIFHNRNKVTSDDVVYTINQIQHPLIDSPKKAAWQGISVTKIDEMTVVFNLKQPYSPFLELVTIGIMPANLWSNLSPEEFAFSALNINAIGSGPYKISSVNRNSSGIADEFILSPFNKYIGGKPFISKLAIRSYANERELGNALTSRNIDIASGLSPERTKVLADKGMAIDIRELPRIFGLFMNKNQNPIFNDPIVVQAVKQSINRQQIIDTVLYGYGAPISGPVPAIFLGSSDDDSNALHQDATQMLDQAGWKVGAGGIRSKTDTKAKTTTSLSFAITTADTPELVATADILKQNLEAVGFSVEVKIYSLGDLNQDIIRPRNYDALLFGEYVTNTGSLYSFWHSSQTSDPGLNVAMYKSSVVDKALTDVLASANPEKRRAGLQIIQSDIEKNAPVAFIYSPLYIEARRSHVQGQSATSGIVLSSDRFRDIASWFIETEKVWNAFIKK